MKSSNIANSIRFISIVFLVPIITIICSSCKNSKSSEPTSEPTTEEKYIAKLKRDTSNSKLMFGLHFGMNRFKVQEVLKELLGSGEILSLNNKGFCYKVNISQIEDSIPPTFETDADPPLNNYAPPFHELYFYAMPTFSNEKLYSIHVTQFLHFNSNDIKDWMNKDLTVVSEKINMEIFARKCKRVSAATDYLLTSKYFFFDVQKISVASMENSPPAEDMTTYWANDFSITMWEDIKYKNYNYHGTGYEGFGKRLMYSDFSGYLNVIGNNDSRILILEYKSPKYDMAGGTITWLFQEGIDKGETIANQKEKLETRIADSLAVINEKKKKKELNKL